MRLRRFLERAAWLLGIGLTLSYGGMRAWSEGSRYAAVRAFSAASEMRPVLVNESSIDQSLWSAQRVAAFAASRVSRDEPDGLLRIPALQLEVPIYDGTGETTLNRGVGRVAGTAPLGTSGNVAIAGHRDGFFRKLKDAQIGQMLYLDTRTRRLSYRIVETRVVEPTRVAVLAPTSRPMITLITCYPFYFVGPAPQRFIVRAEAHAAPPQLTSVHR